MYRHTFCKKCFNIWERNSKNKSCPLCRERYNKTFCSKDLVASNLINELNVLCVYNNCPWIGELNELGKHIKNCCFNPKKMPRFVEDVLKEGIEKENGLNEEDDNEINEKIGFNVNSSLKARLYKKNPELVMNVLRKGKESENKKGNDEDDSNVIISDDSCLGEEEYENILKFLFKYEEEGIDVKEKEKVIGKKRKKK